MAKAKACRMEQGQAMSRENSFFPLLPKMTTSFLLLRRPSSVGVTLSTTFELVGFPGDDLVEVRVAFFL